MTKPGAGHRSHLFGFIVSNLFRVLVFEFRISSQTSAVFAERLPRPARPFVIPSGVEESLTVFRITMRDVSTPLDMTAILTSSAR